MEFAKLTSIPVGGINIQVWGLMLALAMLFALILVLREAKKSKMNTENFIDIFIIVFLAALVGSRLLYVAEHWQNFSGNLYDILMIKQGGLIFYGGFLLSAFCILIYSKFKKISFLKLTDIIVPGLSFGLIIGRIGSYLIGDTIGARTNFFLGSYYHGDLRHEPSLYLAISALFLFIFLVLLKPFVKRKEGVLSYVFVIWYSLSRFLFDFTRNADIVNVADPRYYGLTLSQWLSLVLFVVFVPLLIRKLSKK